MDTGTREASTLRKRIAELEQENAVLLRENSVLRAKVTFFDRAPWMRDGIRGEQVVAKLIGGTTTPVNERFDVLTSSKRVRLEVKYSNRNIAVDGAATMRWTWVHVLGFDNGKAFDGLILVGDADPRYQYLYRDPESPYIFFDVPYDALNAVVRHTSKIVQISTNPRTARTEVARALFNDFQVTRDELISKYRNV
jgi:hypothetical protein